MTSVSRETSAADRARAVALAPELEGHIDALDAFAALLDRWRKVTNLIADAGFGDLWTRHIADSAQLVPLARRVRPGARRWLDLGSGAGFPGLIVAILLRTTPGAEVHCVEADKRKCAFLREAARACGAPAIIHPVRIETLVEADIPNVDIVSARALSPLPLLLEQAGPWLDQGAVGLFPRGASEAATPLDAPAPGAYDIRAHLSALPRGGPILEVKSLKALRQ